MGKLIYIIGRQRSGTTVLRELFVKYGALNADEIFHGDLTRKHRFYAYVAQQAAKDAKFIHPLSHGWLYRQFLSELLAEAGGSPVVIDMKYFAFNLIPGEGDLTQNAPLVIRHLEETRPPVFHVIRRNKLRVHVSERLAQKTGKWSARTERDIPADKGQITLDPLDTILTLRDLEQDDRAARSMLANIPGKREVIYETMFRDNGDFAPYVINGVEAVLGRSGLDPKPSNAKMNPEPLSTLVSNFAELADVLKDTEFGWMLKGE